MSPRNLLIVTLALVTQATLAEANPRTRGDTQCESAADVARWKGTTASSFNAMKVHLDQMLANCEAAAEAVVVITESVVKLEKERRNLEGWWAQETRIREELARTGAAPLGNRDTEKREAAMRRNAERTAAVRNELEDLNVKLKEHEAACKQDMDGPLASFFHNFRGSLTAASRCIDHRLSREGIK